MSNALVQGVSFFSTAIGSVISMFAQLMTAFGANPLIWGVMAIVISVRFILAPFISSTLNPGASDQVKKGRKK